MVVGGGPAGSSAAHMAAKNGCTVALIEKEKEIAQTVRTSGVTWISDIKKFGIPEECYNPIKKFSFCSPKNSVKISGEIAKAAVLDVRKTYRFLANRAKTSGSELFTSTNVAEVLKDDTGKCSGVIAKSASVFPTSLNILSSPNINNASLNTFNPTIFVSTLIVPPPLPDVKSLV